MTVLTIGTVNRDIKFKTNECRQPGSYFENFWCFANFSYSAHVKQGLISNKLIYTSCLTSCHNELKFNTISQEHLWTVVSAFCTIFFKKGGH